MKQNEQKRGHNVKKERKPDVLVRHSGFRAEGS
jgi:hypothetical protein